MLYTRNESLVNYLNFHANFYKFIYIIDKPSIFNAIIYGLDIYLVLYWSPLSALVFVAQRSCVTILLFLLILLLVKF